MLKPLTKAACGVADIIAIVADGIATAGWVWLWQMLIPVVDEKTTRVNYFNLSSGVLNRTSSHMWQMIFANIPIEGWIIDPYV